MKLESIQRSRTPGASWVATLATATLALGLVGACSPQPAVEELSVVEQPLSMVAAGRVGFLTASWRSGIIIGNSLAPELLSGGDALDALRTLAGGALDAEAVADSKIVEAEGGPMLLDYAVRCALATGTELTAGASTYEGRLGLATGWTEGALSSDGKRWVSACLLALTNASGTPVDILVTGKASAPQSKELPSEKFYIQEAAFYGDVFTGADGSSPYAFACVGRDPQLECESGDFTAALQSRLCGEASPCRVRVVGFCYEASKTPDDACAGYPNAYEICYDQTSPRSGPFEGTPYDAVVTAHVRTACEPGRSLEDACAAKCP
jgi:hypothetical protein